MISLLPNTTPSDTNGAFAVLALLTDDNKFKKRLKELVQHAKGAQEVLQAAQKTQTEADKKHAAAEALMAEAQGLHAQAQDANAAIDSRAQAAQDAHNSRLADFEAKIEKAEKALANKVAAHKEKEASLRQGVAQLADDRAALQRSVDAHAAAVAAHEREHKELTGKLNDQLAEVRAKANRFAQMQTELDAKLAKLKALAE